MLFAFEMYLVKLSPAQSMTEKRLKMNTQFLGFCNFSSFFQWKTLQSHVNGSGAVIINGVNMYTCSIFLSKDDSFNIRTVKVK